MLTCKEALGNASFCTPTKCTAVKPCDDLGVIADLIAELCVSMAVTVTYTYACTYNNGGINQG